MTESSEWTLEASKITQENKCNFYIKITSFWGWFLILVSSSFAWLSINLLVVFRDRKHISALLRAAAISDTNTEQKVITNEFVSLIFKYVVLFSAGEIFIFTFSIATPLILKAFIKKK
ncbi:MAG: hypothetical protein H7A32_06035 [Deltaproteobacteria bacterium]|nr:hypothetical protein [Deltaproteobacteria bacterium]